MKIMLSYCLKCGEKSIILQVVRAINERRRILLKCVICSNKNSKFIKKQEANGLLNDLVIKELLSATSLSKIPVLRDILF